jgi:flagellar hook-associated protein 1 FlgK
VVSTKDGVQAQFGSDVQSADNTDQTQQQLLTAIGNQRQSVSGVSLDEEMTNLVTFQRAYQASSRVMTTIDAMLDTLINHTGTVGL